MPSHSETRVLPYSAEQLFDLVMDIEKYPEFLPWCVGARMRSHHENTIEADVIIGYKMFRETFTSRVHIHRPSHISVEYLKGPMRHLHNEWTFKDLKGGKCQVEFHVEFTMKSRLFETLIDQFFHKVLSKMVNAFEIRARKMYG